jgi:Recombination enhancement, RecA-dependent nuclease
MHSTRQPTKYERERMEAMMKLGCAACAYLFALPVVAQECHHILSGGRRMGHWYTIPLCRGHHQGDWSPEQIELIEPRMLVAISDGRKAFVAAYPSERELWELVQVRLRLPRVWPVSKILPRNVA